MEGLKGGRVEGLKGGRVEPFNPSNPNRTFAHNWSHFWFVTHVMSFINEIKYIINYFYYY